jgi:uncharacterized membrane protein YfcA
MASWLVLVVIGLVGGITGGLFGIGGGVIIVPLLIYWAGFSHHKATGTSLAILLPPIGLAAAIEYYRNGNVDLRAAGIVAGAMFVGLGLGACIANKIKGPHLRLMFGIFVVVLGVYLVFGACRRLGWI